MYIAMNRFKINPGYEQGFEEIWASRNSSLDTVPGYYSFKLLKETSAKDQVEKFTMYSTLTIWENEQSFRDWTRSENFRQAHANAGAAKGTYQGPPHLELFDVVMAETKES
ncbi:MAG: antibiotic biosynthesis monooxygenase [Pseudomonadales bacterium]|jgi:heme-degrading monooxygenase HmoA|nr:antibiotic biosynthesis monooxygenase [Pseudomonadales bacterium]MDG1302933.1 antibiotic biosynthesis monooxygenase [Pseudomonadales bacterium]